MKRCLALIFAACAHPVNVPSLVHSADDGLWIGVNGTVPAGMAALHFVDAATQTDAPVCQAPERGRPLWQQLDQGSLRVVCTANPNRLSRSERLEQRYQVPVALAPSAVQHLIVAVPDRSRHARILHEDLLTVADPLALRVDVQRADATELTLPDGAWGVLEMSVGPTQSVVLNQQGDTLSVQVDGGQTLQWTTMAGWAPGD